MWYNKRQSIDSIDINIVFNSDSKGNKHLILISKPTDIIDVETGLRMNSIIYESDIDRSGIFEL